MSELESSGRGVDEDLDPTETQVAADEAAADLEVDAPGSEAETNGAEAEAEAEHDDEVASPAMTCWACQNALRDRYYEVDAQRICDRCVELVKNPQSEGTSFGRFVRAVTYGFGAGVVGASIYYAILALTGYEIGLVAIAVGFMVGYAVKVGSYGRGGWRYQLIAMAITYLAIVMTYVPMIVEGIEQAPPEAAEVSTPADASAPSGDSVALDAVEEADSSSLPPSTTVAEDSGSAGVEPESGGLLTWLVAIILALFAPFVFGLENIMGTIILLIGLYEAWKINQRPQVQIAGPFALAPPDSRASAG